MRKYVIAVIAATLSLVSIVGIAQAQGKPSGTGNNQHGMCTAYFNGQKKGWDKNGTPGPFTNLESAAEAAETPDQQSSEDQNGVDETAPDEKASDVYSYCDQGAAIGGNPDQNGRYASCFQTDGSFSC